MKGHLLAAVLTVTCFAATGTPGRVIDGDTLEIALAIWHGLTVQERVRVVGVNTPERTGPTRASGEAAKAFTEAWAARGPVQVRTCGRDSFGRLLGIVTRFGDSALAQALIDAGHGRPMP